MLIFEKPQTYLCTFEITVKNKVQCFTVESIRSALEAQFINLVNQAAIKTVPVKVKMSRKVPVYDAFNKKWIERENSIVFTNKAWNERN